MKVLVLAVSLFVISLFPTVSWAANHYIRQGASGATCDDWGANACNALPSTLVRGDTYYIAGGTYSGRTFSTSASGTLVITIKGATIADHGTDTGWSNNYSVNTNEGGSQASWGLPITFSTSYWIFDGSVGPILSKTATDYGFSMGTSGTHNIGLQNVSNITIAHVYAKATSSDTEKFFVWNGQSSGYSASYITVSHCLLDGWQGGIVAWTAPINYIVWEYNVCLNGYSSSANHGEWINTDFGTMSYGTFRYNWFEGYSGNAGMTGTIVANNSDNTAPEIYGNVFYNLRVGNGVISSTSAGNITNAKIYNNTFVGMSSDSGNLVTISSGNVYNNISYSCPNSNLSGGSQSNNTNYSSSPFISYANKNFHLAAATAGGTTLSSPYNIDMDGNVRGSDGVWDRGAYEFGTGTVVSKPMAPVLQLTN